jgi:organic hydroperoxide reductase OsmC/OhrA
MSQWVFNTSLEWKSGEEAVERTAGRPDLPVCGPPEFGGPAGQWTPEHLLVGGVESCLLLTTLYFVEKMKIDLRSYESSAGGTMARTAEGLRFTEMRVSIRARVGAEGDVANLEAAVR